MYIPWFRQVAQSSLFVVALLHSGYVDRAWVRRNRMEMEVNEGKICWEMSHGPGHTLQYLTGKLRNHGRARVLVRVPKISGREGQYVSRGPPLDPNSHSLFNQPRLHSHFLPFITPSPPRPAPHRKPIINPPASLPHPSPPPSLPHRPSLQFRDSVPRSELVG